MKHTALRSKADFNIRCARCFRHLGDMPLRTKLPHPLNDGGECRVQTFNQSLKNYSFPRQNIPTLADCKLFFRICLRLDREVLQGDWLPPLSDCSSSDPC